ncbi:hypothetical protein FZ103_15395 [Streptomonospora sp. PA3]|uniref:hypothetical protein n=1 Tax=Streptomonospora sp. PA3 TaxID=2607326 RepID=UPI0012DE9BB7|nr:hypothetical protein [Streptomonospora sp. PA3]MUL42540.1 hypothetical protein [Streptomonospora sp. PA3]
MTELIERVLRRVGVGRTAVSVFKPPSTSRVRRTSRRSAARVRGYAPRSAAFTAVPNAPDPRLRAASRVRPYAACGLAHIRIGATDWQAEFDRVAEAAFAGVGR